MWRAGMREREIMLIYELTRQADIIIDTPVGITDSITVREILKQGTVFGPKLCCISTEKVNSIQHVVSTSLTPEMTIGAPVYVDDILGIGSVETVERVIFEEYKRDGSAEKIQIQQEKIEIHNDQHWP